MAKITMRWRGKIKVDVQRAARVLPPLIIGHVLRRTAQGKDMHDRPFAAYSAGYRRRLTRMGESTKVDLRATGGLLNSLRLLRTEVRGSVAILVFGPDAGTSAEVRTPPAGRRRARRTGRRGPRHNLVGLWLHEGRRGPARQWLGISPSGRPALLRAIERAGIFKTR